MQEWRVCGHSEGTFVLLPWAAAAQAGLPLSSVCQDGCACVHLPADFRPHSINTPVFHSPELSRETERLRETLLSSPSWLQELEMELERQKVG